jgi:uncharacterized membrane protein YdbT with pleckstrin-like domain
MRFKNISLSHSYTTIRKDKMRTELKNDENVVIVIKSHWLSIVWPFVLVIIGLIAGIIIGGYGFIIPVILICYLVYNIIQRNNNLWAVTNLRVIDEFGVFTLNSKESPLDKINNVTYNQTVWGRIFGFGNVQIQTAAEIGSTTYHMVEKPKSLKDTITQMQEEYKKSFIRLEAQELAKAISSGSNNKSKSDIATELEKLFELMQKGALSEQEFNNAKKKILER